APNALARAGVADARRLSPVSDAATASIYPQIAKALQGPPVLLHAAAGAEPDLAVLCASPPVVLVGRRLAQLRARTVGEREPSTDAALRFKLGRIVELTRPRRVFAALGPGSFGVLVRALQVAFGPATAGGPPPDPALVAEAERLRGALPVTLRKRIAEHLTRGGTLDPATYLAACARAADRAGMLACGHVDLAIELAGGAAQAPHLVRLAGAQRYLAARKKLAPRARR
ncbi:MAG: hypothetical protein NT062_20460, partial [Proteobacteria bacterium]|nr:hypothetical protein [Pseudomonadota bacterium]